MALRTWPATSRINGGGTQLPIRITASFHSPAKTKSSGKPEMRLSSGTVQRRFSSQRAWLLADCADRGAFQHYDIIPMGKSVANTMGTVAGFSGHRLHARKPSRTITKNDGNIGLHGHMHWLS